MNNVNTVPLIYLRGVKFCSLSTVLDFIYKGETSIKPDNLQQFLDMAKELMLEDFNQKEEEKLLTQSAVDVLHHLQLRKKL